MSTNMNVVYNYIIVKFIMKTSTFAVKLMNSKVFEPNKTALHNLN